MGWEIEAKVKREKRIGIKKRETKKERKGYGIVSFQRIITFTFSPVPILGSLILPVLVSPKSISKPFSCSLYVGDNNPLNIQKFANIKCLSKEGKV